MKIYRVTFQTDLLIGCDSEIEAERIGYRNLSDEIRNGGSSVYKITEINSTDQLRREERGSLPWRSSDRWGEPQIRVEEILGEK